MGYLESPILRGQQDEKPESPIIREQLKHKTGSPILRGQLKQESWYRFVFPKSSSLPTGGQARGGTRPPTQSSFLRKSLLGKAQLRVYDVYSMAALLLGFHVDVEPLWRRSRQVDLEIPSSTSQ